MTNEQIKYSIETGEIKLKGWDKFSHYSLPSFMFIIPAMIIFFQLKYYFDGRPKAFMEGEIWFFLIIPIILGFLFYRMQRKRLKFKSVDTKLTRDELVKVIEKVAARLEWTPSIVDEKIIIAKTQPGFLSGSWGEQITILFDRDKVLVNSICDPDKQSSVVSFGRNKENTNSLIEEIKKASS